MKTTLALALLLVAGLAAAQNAGSRGSAGGDRQAVKARFREMSAQERTELRAIKADKTKSLADKKAAVKNVVLGYRAKRRALRDQTWRARRGSAALKAQ